MKNLMLWLWTQWKALLKKGWSALEMMWIKKDPAPSSAGFNGKWFCIGLMLGLLIAIHSCSCVQSAEPARNLEDLHAASCRVFATDSNGRGAIGTGTVCGLFKGQYYVLTNWHVVESHRTVKLQFFGDGRITECSGNVIATWHNDSQPFDFAIITVEQDDLAKYDPPFVPLAKRGTRPTTGGMILSSGCSEGRWPFAWKGSVENYYGETAQFFPAPKGGQSGSAIVEKIDGQLQITGVLTWRVGDEGKLSEEEMRGGAIPIAKLYDAFDGKCRTGLPDSVPTNAVWCSQDVELPPPPVLDLEEEIESAKPNLDPTPTTPENNAPNEPAPQPDIAVPAEPSELDPTAPEPNQPVVPEETPLASVPTPDEPERFQRYAIGNTEEYQEVVRQQTIVEMIFFTGRNCPPCKKAEPVVADFVKEGYVIHTIEIDTAEGAEMARKRHVTCTPTFITYRSTDNRENWTEISRFSGIENLRERLLQAFSLGNSGGVTVACEQEPVAQNRDELAPLFSEYGNGWSGLFSRGPKEDEPEIEGDNGSASGIFRGECDGLLGHIQSELRSCLIATLKRCALLIVIFWFAMYAVISAIKAILDRLPKFTVQVKSDD